MAISTKLYDGTVSLEFNPVAHSYMINGDVAPSVTKITSVINKPALLGWAVNETLARVQELWQPEKTYTAEQIRAAVTDAKGARFRTSGKALNIGSQVHEFIEDLIKAAIYGFKAPEMPEYTPVRASVDSYLAWEAEHKVEYVMSERKVCSVKYLYTGTVDAVMRVDGKLCVVDFKTSKGIYDEYFLQVVAYAKALIEELKLDIEKAIIIRVPKDGGDVEIAEVGTDEMDKLFSVFISCLTILRWMASYK